MVLPGHPTSIQPIPVVSQLWCLTAPRALVRVGALGCKVLCWLCISCLVPSPVTLVAQVDDAFSLRIHLTGGHLARYWLTSKTSPHPKTVQRLLIR